jgi:hypothetical protein
MRAWEFLSRPPEAGRGAAWSPGTERVAPDLRRSHYGAERTLRSKAHAEAGKAGRTEAPHGRHGPE